MQHLTFPNFFYRDIKKAIRQLTDGFPG